MGVMRIILLIAVLLVGESSKAFSFMAAYPFGRRGWLKPTSAARVDSGGTTTVLFSGTNDDWNEQLGQVIQKQTRAALVEAIMCPTGSDSLTDMYLVGRGNLKSNNQNNDTFPCLLLSTSQEQPNPGSAASSLVLPLSTSNANAQLKLTSFAYAGRPISKSVCLGLNPLLVNRDDGLFDNLPWSAWSVDPQRRNRDASGNVISPTFHLGKRDAYNRFMGKDWKGRSVSIGNLALRLKYMLQKEEEEAPPKKQQKDNAWTEEESAATLAKRVLELQIREVKMDLAECDYQLAVARMDEKIKGELEELERTRQDCQDRLGDMQDQLTLLASKQQRQQDKEENEPFYTKILDQIADASTGSGKNAPPYRGAMGYAPLLDTKQDVEGSLLPYASPYSLMKEIIEDQLNADVIGAVLENTSLFEGAVVLGGAIILQRRTATKTATVLGEEISTLDEEETFGNEGGEGGATMLVECDSDEAIGMGITCGIPIRVESQIWDRTNLLATPVNKQEAESLDVREAIPLWETLSQDITFVVEGQGQNRTSTSETSPLRIPQTTSSLYNSLFEESPASSSSSTMFPTDNPIQSLSEYDALDNQEKARTLLSMSNFEGKLPRPRVLKEFEANKQRTESAKYAQNPLDEMLLHLIDESVRNQYLIRDAEQRGDFDLAKALRETRSARQVAKEKAERARGVGEEDVAEWWDKEADLYSNLRADVTQDEGAYSRFLDKDEWYERDRQARTKRLKKSNFGTLLDGIE